MEYADGSQPAVLLVTEKQVTGEMGEDIVAASLPHLQSPADRAAVTRHYLGQTNWCELGAHVGVPFGTLPQTKHEALQELEAQGRVIAPLPATSEGRS